MCNPIWLRTYAATHIPGIHFQTPATFSPCIVVGRGSLWAMYDPQKRAIAHMWEQYSQTSSDLSKPPTYAAKPNSKLHGDGARRAMATLAFSAPV